MAIPRPLPLGSVRRGHNEVSDPATNPAPVLPSLSASYRKPVVDPHARGSLGSPARVPRLPLSYPVLDDGAPAFTRRQCRVAATTTTMSISTDMAVIPAMAPQ
jgi:hypothetical protein